MSQFTIAVEKLTNAGIYVSLPKKLFAIIIVGSRRENELEYGY